MLCQFYSIKEKQNSNHFLIFYIINDIIYSKNILGSFVFLNILKLAQKFVLNYNKKRLNPIKYYKWTLFGLSLQLLFD